MITWKSGVSPSKKICRARSSVEASLNTPLPEMLADFTPAPPRSSRQPPALSRLVTSTLSALKLTRVARSPAMVSNWPPPVRSSLIRRSFPAWAPMSVSPFSDVVVHARPERQVDPPHIARPDPPCAGREEFHRHQTPASQRRPRAQKRVRHRRSGVLRRLESGRVGHHAHHEAMLRAASRLVRPVAHIFRPEAHVGARHRPGRDYVVDR